MRIKQSAKYQLSEALKSLIIFYAIVIGLQLVFTIVVAIVSNFNMYGNSSTGGFDTASSIFIFILGLCAFKENFHMLVQNGFSRRSVFGGRAVAALLICGGAAILDSLLFWVFRLLSAGISGFEVSSSFLLIYGWNGVASIPAFVLHNFAFALMVMAAGYLITILFYRLPTGGKVGVGVGVPVLLTIVFPLFDVFVTKGAISMGIARFINFALGMSARQPFMAVLTYLVAACLLGLLAWLLMRRANVKG